ncbi:hypothetical protein D9758_016448 [Tetrapyrgos nigripes]|uniref:Uncharacterized protein n=1 Tax=Tetrapyrgos nigripes TaxID=182062 RepID=A0A8H5CC84_9AGAR|nr:hypothetical protein D9758_016448 [Tetrapyrgos nigripes]
MAAAADPPWPFYTSTLQPSLWAFPPFQNGDALGPLLFHGPHVTTYIQYLPYPQTTSIQNHTRPIQPNSFHRNSFLEMEISPTSPQGARLVQKRLACEAKVQALEGKYKKEREKAVKEREQAAMAENKAKVLEYQLGILRYEAQLGSERVAELERKVEGLQRQLDDCRRALIYW